MLTEKQQLDMIKQTLLKCSSEVLALDDETLLRYVLEELSNDIRNYLDNDPLEILLAGGYLNDNTYQKCIELRDFYLDIEPLLMPEDIKFSAEFQDLAKMSDELIALIDTDK